MTQADWEVCANYAMALFKRGQAITAEHGLTLVDTKYEFGKLPNGTIVLIDEVHTPDSSRFWLAGTHDHIDKEFLRLWFVEHCDPYKDKELPPAPRELVIELSARYIQLFEMITGRQFEYPNTNTPIVDQIWNSLKSN